MRYFFPLFLLLLAFFVFPGLPDVHSGAKAYLFFFFSFGMFLWRVLRGDVLRLDPSLPLWLLLALSLGVSALLSKDPASAFLLLGVWVGAILFFVLAGDFSRSNPDALRLMMWTVLAIALISSLLGLGQYFDRILNGSRGGMLVPYLLPNSWGSRVSGPFGQPNFHALLMLSGLCSFAYVYFVEASWKAPRWIRAGILLPASLLWLNFFWTDSRGGKVALGVIVFASLWLFSRHKNIFPAEAFRRKCLVFAGVAVLSYALAEGTFLASFPQQEISWLRTEQSTSITSRLNMWVASLLMAWDNPFFGIGPDNFKAFLGEYQIRAHDLILFEYEDLVYTRWAHNEYLQVLAEGGGISFLLLVFSIGFVFLRIYRSLKDRGNPGDVFAFLSLLPFFVQASFDWPLRFTPLLALCLALLCVLLPKDECLRLDLNAFRKFVIAGCCLAFLSVGGSVFYRDWQVGKLKDRVHQEEMVESNFEAFKDLSANFFGEYALLSKGVTPFVNYAVRNEDRAMAADLIPFLERGIFLEGAYWQWYNFSRILQVAGRAHDARKSAERSVDLNPNYLPAWDFIHHLDILNAAKKTGRPVESFYPNEPPNLDLPYDGNRTPQYQQNL